MWHINYPIAVRSVGQIELTSRCNLRCVYCPHPKMTRPKIDMTWEIYEKALDLAEYYLKRKTQRTLWLHGLGESTLHPEFAKMFRHARARLPNAQIGISSNGVSFTKEHAEAMAECNGILHFSLHRPEKVMPAAQLAKEAGIKSITVHANFALSAFNWAGQVDWEVEKKESNACHWLRDAWCNILADGDIISCCMGAEKQGLIGNVNSTPAELLTKPFDLCKTCEFVP